jgi:hypothetical protein
LDAGPGPGRVIRASIGGFARLEHLGGPDVTLVAFAPRRTDLDYRCRSLPWALVVVGASSAIRAVAVFCVTSARKLAWAYVVA